MWHYCKICQYTWDSVTKRKEIAARSAHKGTNKLCEVCAVKWLKCGLCDDVWQPVTGKRFYRTAPSKNTNWEDYSTCPGCCASNKEAVLRQMKAHRATEPRQANLKTTDFLGSNY